MNDFTAPTICGICLAAISSIYGQSTPSSSSAPTPEPLPSGVRRLAFGFRVNGLPFNVLLNHDTTVTTTELTPATWNFSTSNTYLQIAFGPSVEFAVSRKFTLSTEVLYHRLSYTKVTDVTQGIYDTTFNEQTRATLWDAPVMLRYRGLREKGVLSKLYFSGGGALRKVSHIRTANDTTFATGATASDSNPVEASERNVAGLAVGTGFRFVDDFHIKMTPELRYTRWLGATFESDSTRMRRDELAVGLGFTF